MKNSFKVVACLLAWLVVTVAVHAQNICIDSTNVTDSQCLYQGTVNTLGTLSYTNYAVCIGVPIPRPTATTTIISDGSSAQYDEHSCPDFYYLNGWVTNAETYVASPVYFDPPIPESFATVTNFQTTAYVDGIDQQGFCPNIVGIVLGTITITCSDCDLTESDCSGGAPSLLGYWGFNSPMSLWSGEANGNDTVGTNTGTWTGTAAYTTGVVGQAFNFNGSNYVSCGTNVGNFGTNDFTIDFWLQTTQSGWVGILGNRPASCGVAPSMWQLALYNGSVIFEIQDTSSSQQTSLYDRVVNDGAFHRITVIRHGLSQQFYIDGVLDKAVTTGTVANLQNNDGNMVIGGTGCSVTPHLAGVIDEINIFADTSSPWTGNRGQTPLAVTNVQQRPSPWGNGLQVDSSTNSTIRYRYIDDDGIGNINCKKGAIRFWFSPNWISGSGPGNPARLLEMGDTNSVSGWWCLWVDPTGSSLKFESKSNGVLETCISYPITGWSSNTWYYVVLDYSFDSTKLYIDGTLAQTGLGLTNYPSLSARLAHGFSIGSDYLGVNQARGLFDEVATFNCPLSDEEVAEDFLLESAAANTGNEPDDRFWEIIQQPFGVTIDNPSNGSTLY